MVSIFNSLQVNKCKILESSDLKQPCSWIFGDRLNHFSHAMLTKVYQAAIWEHTNNVMKKSSDQQASCLATFKFSCYL